MQKSTLVLFYEGMKDEVYSEFNRWVASEKAGHSATPMELWIHYIIGGGMSRYFKIFREAHPFLMEEFHSHFSALVPIAT